MRIDNKKGRDFGLTVRRKRRFLELTQEEVASFIGISRYSMILLEQGKFNPPPECVLKLNKLLKTATG